MIYEKQIGEVLDDYLEVLGDEGSILKGNLLPSLAKEFILDNPNAFVIGLIADQSVKAEIAWSLPYKLFGRLDTFDFDYIVNNLSVDIIEDAIKRKPALHRYPSRMAVYIYGAMEKIINDYDGDASNIWKCKGADVIIDRFEEFKGISHKKACLGALLLIRDLGMDISNKSFIDIAYDVHIRRIFLRLGLVDDDTMEKVISSAKHINPSFPGKLTTSFWSIGRNYCYAANPRCSDCPLKKYCKYNGDEV